MPTPTSRARPLTSAYEYRNKVLGPLLQEAHRRQVETCGVSELNSTPHATLRFKLDGQDVAIRLDCAAGHEVNLSEFTSALSGLRQLAATEGDPSEKLGRLESLMAGKAAQANLEALFQLWHRAVYSTQCEGHILLPAHLIDTLLSQLEHFTTHVESFLSLAGARLSLGVLAAVEPALQALAERCLQREREVAGRDSELAVAYGRLAFELRSLEALAIRFMEDRRYRRSCLLVPQDLPLLRRQLLQQGLQLQVGDQAMESAESLDALLWALQEGPPADVQAWEEALDRALEGEGAQPECRMLLALGSAAGQRAGAEAMKSREFLEAQVVALEVLVLACIALEVGDCLGASTASAAPGHPGAAPWGEQRPEASTPRAAATAGPGTEQALGASMVTAAAGQCPAELQRLMAVAGAAQALLPEPLHSLRAARSPFLESLLEGGSSAVQLVQEIERREGRLRLAGAEARAERAEQLVRELQLQVAAQRRAQREVVLAQQQLALTWLSVMETQVDMSKAQRSCLEESTRELRAAVAQLTVPEVELPAVPLLAHGSASEASEPPPLTSLSSSPASTSYRPAIAAARQDSLRQETLRQDSLRQETLRQDSFRHDLLQLATFS